MTKTHVQLRLLPLFLQGGGYSRDHFVGNDRDPLLRLQAQAIADGVPGAGLEFRIDGYV